MSPAMGNELVDYYEQGDVLLKVRSTVPKGYVLHEGEKALQHGETTGHMHRFLMTDKVDIYVPPMAERINLSNGMTIVPGIGKYIVVREEAYLRHEEHKPILVPPGTYEMDLVREYDYEKDEMRRVVD